ADRPVAEPRATPPPPKYVQYPPPPRAQPQPEVQVELEPTEDWPRSAFWSRLGATLGALSMAYFLLPGPFEWEARGQREFALTGLIPPLGVVVWLATTGHLAPVLG